MSFAEAQARLQAAVFDRLGEDAEWQGVAGTVRVIRRDADEEFGLPHGSAIVDGHRLRVRQSEVPAPAIGQVVQILDSSGAAVTGAAYLVEREPRLDRKGVWTCIAAPTP